jgi:serine/threonine protein kinase
VAIKLLNKEYTLNENIRKRFLAEAKSMFRMSHPNIIKVTDLIDEGDTVAFVMEYIQGETLKEYIERKRKLSDEEIIRIFSQMLEAVGYVHQQKLVHRDIKPSNFMITSSGSVKLLDFGIAKTTDSSSAEYTQTGTSMQMGTPMYMSPEQITETKSVTHQSDIYSLGVVLWQMVTGKKPYEMNALSNFQLQNKIVNETLPKTNTFWDRFIEKATFKEIGNRFSDCRTFINSLNSLNVKQQRTNKEDSVDHTIIDKKTDVINDENSSTFYGCIPALLRILIYIIVSVFITDLIVENIFENPNNFINGDIKGKPIAGSITALLYFKFGRLFIGIVTYSVIVYILYKIDDFIFGDS